MGCRSMLDEVKNLPYRMNESGHIDENKSMHHLHVMFSHKSRDRGESTENNIELYRDRFIPTNASFYELSSCVLETL